MTVTTCAGLSGSSQVGDDIIAGLLAAEQQGVTPELYFDVVEACGSMVRYDELLTEALSNRLRMITSYFDMYHKLIGAGCSHFEALDYFKSCPLSFADYFEARFPNRSPHHVPMTHEQIMAHTKAKTVPEGVWWTGMGNARMVRERSERKGSFWRRGKR
jgi:hypothetical protein